MAMVWVIVNKNKKSVNSMSPFDLTRYRAKMQQATAILFGKLKIGLQKN